jgi:hypothetical protein
VQSDQEGAGRIGEDVLVSLEGIGNPEHLDGRLGEICCHSNLRF